MNITERTGAAAKAFIAAQSLTTVTTFYAGEETANNSDDTGANVRTPPCVTMFGTDAEEFPPLSGNYRLNLHILVEASFDETTPTAFDAMCNEVFSKFHTTTIAADLSTAYGGFTCLGIAGSVSQVPEFGQQHRLRRQEMIIPMFACASDLAA